MWFVSRWNVRPVKESHSYKIAKYRDYVNIKEMGCFTNAFFSLGMWSCNYESRMIMSLCTQVTFPSKMYHHSCSRLVVGHTYCSSSHSNSELCFQKVSIYTQLLLHIYSLSWYKLKLPWATSPSYSSNLSRDQLFVLMF